MPFQPGTPATQMPDDGDALIRRVQELERTVRELSASVAGPVTFDTDVAWSSGDAVLTTKIVMATATLQVPAGYSTALVRAFAMGMAINSTASADYLSVQAEVAGLSGGETYQVASSGQGVSVTTFSQRTLTGLSAGASIVVTVKARTDFAGWAANVANQFNIHAEATFLR